MFKFETLVTVMISLCLSTPTVFAANSIELKAPVCDSRVSQERCDKAWDNYNAALARQANETSDCKSLEDNYLKVKGEFTDACGDAKIGDKNCAEALDKCDAKDDETREETGTAARKKRDSNRPLDVNAAKSLYDKCPSMAGVELDKYEKQLKEQQEKVKKLEKEIPELQEKANKVMNSTNEKLQQIKTEQSEAAKEHAKELQALDQERQGAEKAISDQILGIQVQISKANDDLGKISVARHTAQIKRNNDKADAAMDCHKEALVQVSKMQAEVLASINMGTYNRSNFTGLLKNVGVSDRRQWQRVAKRYYDECMRDDAIRIKKDAANNNYDIATSQMNNDEKTIRNQIQQLQTQQLTLRDNRACGQPTMQPNGSSSGGETALCQAARNTYTKAQNSEAEYRTKAQTANEKYMQQQDQGNREYQSFYAQAQKKQQEIKEEQARLDNLKEYLQAKYDAGASGNTDGKATSKARQKRNQLESTALDLISCKAKSSSKNYSGDYCAPDNSCKNIANFLRNELKTKPEKITDASTREDSPEPEADPLPGSSNRPQTNVDPAAAPTDGTSTR